MNIIYFRWGIGGFDDFVIYTWMLQMTWKMDSWQLGIDISPTQNLFTFTRKHTLTANVDVFRTQKSAERVYPITPYSDNKHFVACGFSINFETKNHASKYTKDDDSMIKPNANELNAACCCCFATLFRQLSDATGKQVIHNRYANVNAVASARTKLLL